MSNTGVGIHKDNPEVWDNFFQKTVLQVCPSYYLLEETLMQYYNPTILGMRLGDKDEQQWQETRRMLGRQIPVPTTIDTSNDTYPDHSSTIDTTDNNRTPLQEAQEDNINCLIQKIGGINLATDTEQKDLTLYSDSLSINPAWPNPGDQSYICIFLMSLGFLQDMQVDIFGITEPNLDLSQPQVKFDILVKSL